MSSFTTPLIVEPLPDGRNWRLVEEFEFWYEDKEERRTIKIPAGFVTDFASVPRLFWNALPPWGKYGKAAVVHDYCYRTGCLSRKKCDQIFLEGMRVLGVPFWKRHVMYWAVRLFGGYAYKGRSYTSPVQST